MNSPYPDPNKTHAGLLADRIKSLHQRISLQGQEIRECRQELNTQYTLIYKLIKRIEMLENGNASS